MLPSLKQEMVVRASERSAGVSLDLVVIQLPLKAPVLAETEIPWEDGGHEHLLVVNMEGGAIIHPGDDVLISIPFGIHQHLEQALWECILGWGTFLVLALGTGGWL